MTTEVRDARGYLRVCAHTTGDVILCASCLMREADLIDLRAKRMQDTQLDLRASILKARRTLKQTQAGLARLMKITPQNLSDAKRGVRALPYHVLNWLIQQGFMVEPRPPKSA